MNKKFKFISLTIITSLMLNPISALALTKDENVYTNLNYDGTVASKTVSNRITNSNKEDIEDETKLKEILNISGNEKYTSKEDKIVWQADGNDIIYQGTTDIDLPIETEIKYYLNDKETDIKDIVGKSGKIKITLNFKNKRINTVKINGKLEKLYTPFVVTVGTMLDVKDNKNISIDNGKTVNTGSRNMIVGIASPGLYDSIKIDELKGLDSINISFDTTNFNPKEIYMVATPNLLSQTDLNVFKKMDSLYSNINLLQKNMNEIEKGSKKLKDGANNILDGNSKLSQNIKIAQSSITKIKEGAIGINSGVNQIITSLKAIQSELSNNEDLKKSLASLDALKNKNNATINALVTKTGKTKDELKTIYVNYNLKNYTGDDATLMSVKSTYELIMLLEANNSAIDGTKSNISGLTKKVNDNLTALETGLNKVNVVSGKVSDGLVNLEAGIAKLYNGSVLLVNGSKDLKDGATTLSNGTKKFNKEGINKLSNYASTIKKYSNKVDKLVELSKDYKGYASNNSTTTNFISVVKYSNLNK